MALDRMVGCLVAAWLFTGCEWVAGRHGEWGQDGSIAVGGDDVDAAVPAPLGPYRPPPPISGGTLIVLSNNVTAAASDPDRDRVYLVALDTHGVSEVQLKDGDEPGRVVEGAPGLIHVALRRGGAIVTIDTAAAAIVGRRPVCAAPRGLAYDATRARLHVACLGGELITLSESDGQTLRAITPATDLRDIVIDGPNLLVSRFRAAEVLVIAEDGNVIETLRSPPFSDPGVRKGARFEPSVGWRLSRVPSGGAVLVHQRAMASELRFVMGQSYYSDPPPPMGWPSGVVHGALTTFRHGQPPVALGALSDAVLPVDVAVSPDGKRLAVVAAANGWQAVQMVQFQPAGPSGAAKPATFAGTRPSGQVIAAAWTPLGDLVTQTREPATLLIASTGSEITLSTESRDDPGHDRFHLGAGTRVACASCHPEGGEDGRVWPFQTGIRRTQSLRGGILGTEPFHWSGELPSFDSLVDEVWTNRMGGPTLDTGAKADLGRWINSIPALAHAHAPDAAQVARGQALFADPNIGCASCHAGPRFTNNKTVDVGTGGPLQVPSLTGVFARAPYLHNGCAATLRDRFGPCGGGTDQHGKIDQLLPPQIDDLVAYLQTL